MRYPPATKPLYLRSKALYKKKLALATKLTAMKRYYGIRDPSYTSFNCPPANIMKNPESKKRWEDLVTTTKRSLLTILIEDLEEQYQATKAEIYALDVQLKQHLSQADWAEMSSTLDRKYKAAVPSQVQRSNKIFPKDRKMAESKRRKPNGPRQGQQGKKSVFKPKKGDDLSALAKLLVKQMNANL